MKLPFLLALASALLPAMPVLAQTQPIRVLNRAPVTATALYLAPSGTASWGANLLGGLFLPPGAFMAVQLGEGGGCRFDLRLVLRDGREALRRNVDVCTERVVAMTLDAAVAPQTPAATTLSPPATAGEPEPGGSGSQP